ncbi:very-long-chain 3-oxoacyl-CoA reductase-B-like isoform X2 [Hyperolius riggenbachi]|uniref:very-long-chain 3-oxoacyl-CoA reductase-B-like isoform X2 n=1 Tax=Hyperolius riggenbachi TaxID=752182 RepID=UPI0035A2EA1F
MSDSMLYQGLTQLGFLALSYLLLKQVYKLLKGFRVHILSRWWKADLKKYGGWAVVTGATDGIGKAYAKELAKRGFNVVLVSRSMEKLQRVAKEIEQLSGCKSKIIQVDFTGGSEIYPKIEENLKDVDIGILVNNVGMVHCYDGRRFHETMETCQQLTDIINCNILSMIQMTRIVIPRMVDRKKGLIINVSSECGSRPIPRLSVYSGTKVFIDFFSRSLDLDYRPLGINVQSYVLDLFLSDYTMRMKLLTSIGRLAMRCMYMPSKSD